jgi:peptidoglycan/xylan/chitin deacetylase (PgdA/CDA1 family)
VEKLSKIDFQVYVRGFRPPYWAINEDVIEACNKLGMWVAFRDTEKFHMCKHGYYHMQEKGTYWFGHTWRTWENNWITERLPELLAKWPKDQQFRFVSEAIVKP